MSNAITSTTIQVLESLGRSPLGSRILEDTAASSGIGSPEYRAQLDRNIESLRVSSHGREAMRCLIATPD